MNRALVIAKRKIKDFFCHTAFTAYRYHRKQASTQHRKTAFTAKYRLLSYGITDFKIAPAAEYTADNPRISAEVAITVLRRARRKYPEKGYPHRSVNGTISTMKPVKSLKGIGKFIYFPPLPDGIETAGICP